MVSIPGLNVASKVTQALRLIGQLVSRSRPLRIGDRFALVATTFVAAIRSRVHIRVENGDSPSGDLFGPSQEILVEPVDVKFRILLGVPESRPTVSFTWTNDELYVRYI